MKIFRGNQGIEGFSLSNPVVTIGNFDGCHLGHQEIFKRVREHAARVSGVSVVYTFEPHPAAVLRDIRPELIFTLEEKIEAIAAMGMDYLVVAPFTRVLANTDPEVFVREVLVKQMNIKGLVFGYDFSFGKKATGDIPFLQRVGSKMGFFVERVDSVVCLDAPVSSTRIRKLIESGDVAAARQLMLRPYCFHGAVIHGMARGRSMGFPTANIRPDKDLIPAYGVYAVFVEMDGQRFQGALNIGNNPTFSDVGTSIEVFIFDFDGDIYGSQITIEFVEHIRGETRFADKTYLIEQIHEDCIRARQILGKQVDR